MKDKPGPLSGLNILDFTWVIAGPHATRTFADMGANVLKIEHFKNGTNERHQALQVEKNGVTQSSYHINLQWSSKNVQAVKQPFEVSSIAPQTQLEKDTPNRNEGGRYYKTSQCTP